MQLLEAVIIRRILKLLLMCSALYFSILIMLFDFPDLAFVTSSFTEMMAVEWH